ncbi:MAG TPA: hypothetical protein VF559_04360 [Caulobacteraceae bacterium]|jgi:hypothetical protein
MSGRAHGVEEPLQGQALLLVKMMTELFEEADTAETPEQHKSVARKAWTQNSLGRA